MNKNEKYSIENYDRIASNYDNTFDGKFTRKFKTEILEIIEPTDGVAILDVGCGNGNLISAIKTKADINAFGIDISSEMIKECKKTYSDINFQVSNGEHIPFEDNFFDYLTICCVLHHLNNPEKFFSEAKRVLKIGGTLIVGEPWIPPVAKPFVDYIFSPLLKAGDNKVFSHKKLKNFLTKNNFSLQYFKRKGIMQIVSGKKSV
ncbi:MAG: class I SAM-dependent methyltransferase [Oscillospiraceae bacterium]|jgi:ubiquinone/menaquinone biosynthesis C-methylase UbiE|nr:class I SAM-dependent methyltransferase [Oscillospiraceae bacterium]